MAKNKQFPKQVAQIEKGTEPAPVLQEAAVPKDLTAAELYAAIYDAGPAYENTPAWGELRRRLLRWPKRRLMNTGHFLPDKRWRPIV